MLTNRKCSDSVSCLNIDRITEKRATEYHTPLPQVNIIGAALYSQFPAPYARDFHRRSIQPLPFAQATSAVEYCLATTGEMEPHRFRHPHAADKRLWKTCWPIRHDTQSPRRQFPFRPHKNLYILAMRERVSLARSRLVRSRCNASRATWLFNCLAATRAPI